MLGCTIFAQKKDAHQRKIPPICVHTLYIKPKDLISRFLLPWVFALACTIHDGIEDILFLHYAIGAQ